MTHWRLMWQMLGPAAAEVPDPFGNLDRIAACTVPVLVIHGDRDQIVPYGQAKQLIDSCGSAQKLLVTITGGGHNDLCVVNSSLYHSALAAFVDSQGDREQVLRALPPSPTNRCCVLM